MKYPYADRDLFEQPERYFYARCAGRGFLAAWRTSRSEARRRLQEQITCSGREPVDAPSTDGDGKMPSQQFDAILNPLPPMFEPFPAKKRPPNAARNAVIVTRYVQVDQLRTCRRHFRVLTETCVKLA